MDCPYPIIQAINAAGGLKTGEVAKKARLFRKGTALELDLRKKENKDFKLENGDALLVE